MLVSPSLDGVLLHEPVIYEGIERPVEVLKIYDGPSSKGRTKDGAKVVLATEKDHAVLERYFHDLYGIFIKNISRFATEDVDQADMVKLQAMLQELVKIKRWLNVGPS